MVFIVLLLIIVQTVLSAPIPEDLVVLLPDGQVQGITYTSENNKTYYGFQGIPYATPPLGILRFEAPQKVKPWTGVWDGTKDAKACLSADNSDFKDLESEDCLFVSVYVPSVKTAQKLPVMLWIYGGKFQIGNSRKAQYDPEFLVEEDVIVVQFNYRLGAFGLLSTGDSAIVGNAGLKDQALAIKWTHDNIEYFGGDPAKITIFGESAGGVSVGLQLLNKKVTGLFRAAIVQSGSAVNNWTIDQNPKAYADLLATELGGEIYLNDTQQLKKFLQGISAEELLNAANLLTPRNEKELHAASPKNQPWPVIEVENKEAVLTESPYELLDSGRFNQVPIIIGVCANEAIMILQGLEIAQEVALGFDTYPDTLIPSDLRQNSSDNDAVIRAIQNLYLQEGETFSSNLVSLTSYLSENMFIKGTIKHAELASKYVPVYFYQFAYYGRAAFPFFIPGAEKASHTAELPFLFKNPLLSPIKSDATDLLVQNRIVKLWTNFAKFLDPTPEQSELIDVTWPTMSATELQFLNINDTLEVREPIRGASYKGWNEIYETYGKKPFITF